MTTFRTKNAATMHRLADALRQTGARVQVAASKTSAETTAPSRLVLQAARDADAEIHVTHDAPTRDLEI